MFESDYRENTSYISYNNWAIFGHFLSAVCMIILIVQNGSISIPYTESFLEWKNVSDSDKCQIGSRTFNTSNGKFCISSVTKPVSCDDDGNCYGIDLGWLIISFHILSFVFQLIASFTYYCTPLFGFKYNQMIKEGKNPLRFIEYSFSASIMLISIALLNGVTDINLITSIAVLTSACQLCGLSVEYVDNIKIKWLLHLTGWMQFCWAYGIIFHAFFKSIDVANEDSGSGPPSFVYVIVIALFLLYSSFGFVQLFEMLYSVKYIRDTCLNKKENIDPVFKEKAYICLSLTAKLLLGWMIFGNVLILSR